jgi:probable F420-dependent oxidoreductase
MSRFRFGVTLFPVIAERREWTDTVKRAEAAGFSVVTVIDHFGTSGGIFPSLVTAYEAAPSLRVGTLVLNSDFWHPMLLAREVATADVLTDGRFELGLGAGWDLGDYRAMGLERKPASERIAKLDEAIDVLELAFAGGPVRHRGKYYTIETESLPTPRQAHVPLAVGGGGRGILELAARRADIVSLHRELQRGVAASWQGEAASAGAPDRVAERVGWVRAAAGERFDRLELHALVQRIVVTERRREVAAELGRANGFDADAILSSPHFLVGTVDELVEDLLARRSRWGISYWTLVGGGEIETFAPIVERLAGA